MKLKLDRIISIATLVAALIAIILVLKKPAPVMPQAPATVIERVQSADPNPSQFQQPEQAPSSVVNSGTPAQPVATPAPQSVAQNSPSPKTNSDAIGGALAKLFGGGASELTPESKVGNGDPVIKDQQVTMDGDVVHGKFLTEIAGKDVWVTISGHMGEKDGYATFDPTEIKVGDMNVPVALVNPALQRKMAEERDRLKVPNGGASAQ